MEENNIHRPEPINGTHSNVRFGFSSLWSRRRSSSLQQLIGQSIETLLISLKQMNTLINRLLFSKDYLRSCAIIIIMLLPLVIYSTPDLEKVLNTSINESLSYRGFLVPVFLILVCTAWGILNFFHSFVFNIEYTEHKNRNQMNYFNCIVFQPLFYVIIMKASIMNKLIENRIDRLVWVFVSVIFDFIYSYTDYLFSHSVEKCSKVVLIDDLLIIRRKVLGEFILLICLNILYSYLLFSFFISVYEFNFIFFYISLSKGAYLLFNQIELLYSALDSYNQITGKYINDERSYLWYLKIKCYCGSVNYCMFVIYVVFFWNAVQDFNTYLTTFFVIYLMILHYKSIKRLIDIFLSYIKARNFFAELNQM